ncbi:periplasmic protein involved in polysaccharide export [Anopheles sinensis]|uniref:Periplasmic protein involved in polysaccharide export n=1 Tax=Anopheles sinensis TaxID=74873 RepID=A0A084VR73_ANOSI|nr:periplasmic protein involved in polysaccharide export [Anopheles sinensis]
MDFRAEGRRKRIVVVRRTAALFSEQQLDAIALSLMLPPGSREMKIGKARTVPGVG